MAFPIDQQVTNPGQVNNAGDSRATFLKLFAGEVLKAHRVENMALKLTRKRTIKKGKSASFPLLGRGMAKYHTPGQLIEADKIPSVDRVVTIDDVAISAVFIADIEEAMNHWDARQPYSQECGSQLGEVVDRNIFRMIAKAALIEDGTGMTNAGLTAIQGQEYNLSSALEFASTADETDGQKIYEMIIKARTQFRKLNIKEKPVCVLPPEQYEALVSLSSVTAAPWMNRDVGGVGSAAQGEVPIIGGIKIYESNNLPQANESAGLISDPEPLADTAVGSGNQAKYRGDYSINRGLIFSPSAVATTELLGLKMKWVDEPLRIGSTVLAHQAVGHDILRPECAVMLEAFTA